MNPFVLNNKNINTDMLADSLSSIVDTYTSHKIIVGGDFNAHIGNHNQIVEEIFTSPHIRETREALHTKINQRGSKLAEAIENLGFIVGNGRILGDTPGKYTFLNFNGKTTVD